MNSSLSQKQQLEEKQLLWVEQLTDSYFRRLPPTSSSYSSYSSSYSSPSSSSSSLDNPSSSSTNNNHNTYLFRLIESARSLLAAIAPLHRVIDHCRLCIAVSDEASGKCLESGLFNAQNRTVELVRALEKVDEQRDGSGRLEDVSHPSTSTTAPPSSSSSSSPSSSRVAQQWTTLSLTTSPATLPNIDSAVLDELTDRCANATTSYRTLLRDLRPHLSRLGRHLDPRRLRSILLATHGAAAELSEAWTSLAFILAEPRPVLQTAPQFRQGRTHGQPSPLSNQSSPPTPRSKTGETTENAVGGTTGPLRTVSSTSSSTSPPEPTVSATGRNRGIPDLKIRSTAEAAVVVANRVLALLVEDLRKNDSLDSDENSSSSSLSPDPVIGFGKQVPVARQATTNLASALEAMALFETKAGITVPSDGDVGKRTAAGGKVMEEAEEFVKSVIYLSTLAKEATTHRKDHPLSQSILSGIGMVTRSTKELALALQAPYVAKKTNEVG